MNKNLTRTPIVIFLAILCCALWGSAFPYIKIGYRLFDIDSHEIGKQLLFAGMRFFIAGVMVIITGSIVYKKILRPTSGSTTGRIIALAMVQTVAQYFFFYVGLANTTGSKAAIVEAMNVFFAILVSGYIFRLEKVTLRKLLGCTIGFAGVVLVNLSSGGISSGIKLNGEGFILLSTLAYAFSSVLIKYFSKKDDPVLLSGYQFVAGGAVLSISGLIMGGRLTIPSIEALGVLLYLAFISAAAYTIWSLLLKYNPVSKVSVFGFSNPVFGVLLSAFLLNEKDSIGISCLIALILVSVGIIIVNAQKKTQ